ncbi:MAG TPA: hypothetical protein VFC99_04735 [Acidimicrobiia bacterium]|nr:hypothetical protein [Acidimicrobiia bacterium]
MTDSTQQARCGGRTQGTTPNMAAVTTVPGILELPVVPATHRRAARTATPRRCRASRATYRRRRVFAAILVLGAVVVMGEAGAALGGFPLAAPERRPISPSSVVVVRDGDTLWSIVERARPGEDPRPIVDALSATRDGAPLQPGETVRLPE